MRLSGRMAIKRGATAAGAAVPEAVPVTDDHSFKPPGIFHALHAEARMGLAKFGLSFSCEPCRSGTPRHLCGNLGLQAHNCYLLGSRNSNACQVAGCVAIRPPRGVFAHLVQDLTEIKGMPELESGWSSKKSPLTCASRW